MQESKSETRWISVFLLWGIGLAAAMQFAKLSISLSDLSNHYSVKESWIALLLSSVGFTGIVLGAAAGAIVGAVGPRKALLTALIVGIIASALQSLMPAFGLMLGSRVFEGLSHLLIVVAAPTAIITISADRHKSITMGIWATFFGVAYAVTGFGGVPILENYGLSS